jgi:LysR family transcriptional activator of nhaA
MLLPTSQNGVRQLFDPWANEAEIFPSVRGQFDDSALIKSFGQEDLGIFLCPVSLNEKCVKFLRCKF